MKVEKDRCKILKKKKKIKSKKNMELSFAGSGILKVDKTSKRSKSIEERKNKLKKKLTNLNVDGKLDNNIDQFHEAKKQSSTPLLKKNKKNKKRKIETESIEAISCEDCDKVEEPTKKKTQFLKTNDQEYKPGMISDALQTMKYGRVIMPWDPSFGLDKEYNAKYGKETPNSEPKLKINPVFDFSRRRNRVLLPDEAGSIFFIGNLPSNTKIMDLKKLFAKHGRIYKAKLKKKKFKIPNKTDENEIAATEINTVSAIIKFKTLKSSEAVLNMNGNLYKDHHLRVTLLTDQPNIVRDRSVFVGNLAFKAQDDELWKAFEDCGEIESVRIVRDERSGKGRGFGFVNFKSAESVEAALKLEGKLVLGRELRVKKNSSKAVSLSNQNTVKRKKVKKKRKPLLRDDTCTKPVKKLKKIKKSSHDSGDDTEAQCELLTSRVTDLTVEKKKKKKKKKQQSEN